MLVHIRRSWRLPIREQGRYQQQQQDEAATRPVHEGGGPDQGATASSIAAIPVAAKLGITVSAGSQPCQAVYGWQAAGW